jgi:hypothetical protein
MFMPSNLRMYLILQSLYLILVHNKEKKEQINCWC